MSTSRRLPVVFVAGLVLIGSTTPAFADAESSVDLEVPYLGEVSQELPEGWTAAECPQGAVPDLVEVRCDATKVTFVGLGYSPDVGPQDVVIASTTASGATQAFVYVVTLTPPTLAGPADQTYGHPLGKGTRTTIPFAELRYDCGACTEQGPTYTGLTVEPANAASVRFTGHGLEFAPAPGFVGDAQLTFAVRDVYGQETEPTVLTVTVVPGHSQAPIAVPDSTRGDVDAVQEGNLLDNDTRVGEANALVTRCGQPSNGSVECEPDGSFVYTPNPGFTGLDQFAYHTVTENSGDQAVGSVVVGVGADPAVVDDQKPGVELAPLFAPGSGTARPAAPGALTVFRDAVGAIPRGAG